MIVTIALFVFAIAGVIYLLTPDDTFYEAIADDLDIEDDPMDKKNDDYYNNNVKQ